MINYMANIIRADSMPYAVFPMVLDYWQCVDWFAHGMGDYNYYAGPQCDR